MPILATSWPYKRPFFNLTLSESEIQVSPVAALLPSVVLGQRGSAWSLGSLGVCVQLRVHGVGGPWVASSFGACCPAPGAVLLLLRAGNHAPARALAAASGAYPPTHSCWPACASVLATTSWQPVPHPGAGLPAPPCCLQEDLAVVISRTKRRPRKSSPPDDRERLDRGN